MNTEEFEDLLRRVVFDTREKLRKAINDDAPGNPRCDASVLTQTFAGCCGLAQCIAGYFLQDLDVKVRAIATQSLPACRQGHALLSVAMCDQAGERWYLLDPTFVQFCHRGSASVSLKAPTVSASGTGDALAAALVREGFAELSADTAAAYLSFFCGGDVPFESAVECIAFCKNPPPHPYHFNAGDGTNRFSRPELGRQNLTLLAPQRQ